MSALLFLFVLIILGMGYFFYGGYISKVLGIDPLRKTPAVTHYDEVDYVPAKNWLILFGHHFASIAGAGPIVGPIFSYIYWGWVGVLIWLVFGSIFMGAVHDFSSLFVSLREEGRSLGQIAQKYISSRVSIVFLIFLWFALIIVIAVFADICAKTFIKQPQVVIPSLGLIPVAIMVGLLIYQWRKRIFFSTLLGLIFLFFLILLGERFPLLLKGDNGYHLWIIVLFVYAFFASIIPVHILLQPRDYLASFLLFFGIIVALGGIFLKPLPLPSSQLFVFTSSAGAFFPVMFITVACGSISGFHSLVASGTTSKQIGNEADAQKIAYGGMILEAVLATVALFCVVFGIKALNGEKNPILLFAQGFGNLVFFLGDKGKYVALVILNAFILTTLDTATRISRLLTQELLKLKNKFLATFIVVGVGGYLCVSGSWQVLWPMFGASNQLLASLALIVVSAYLIKKGKNYLTTLLPGLVMFLIAMSAIITKLYEFISSSNYLLLIIGIILFLLGVFILKEFAQKSLSLFIERRQK